MAGNKKAGILLINLGTSKSPDPKDIKPYLDEFLMDKYVMDVSYPLRVLLVRGIILGIKKRANLASEAYKRVWMKEGSPLMVYSERAKNKLQSKVSVPVELAMRYQQPSIESGMRKLAAQGVEKIVLVPLYPQYAMSTTKTVLEKVEEIRKKKFPKIETVDVKPFYNRESYITVLANKIKANLPEEFDQILFSYHSIPERHVFKTDPTHTCDLKNCASDGPNHQNHFCYVNHSYEITRLVAEKLGLPKVKVMTSFQSRLGKTPWVQPYTDVTLEGLPKKGVKKLVVVSPAFVADCLETLDEMCIEGKETFLHAGGQEFTYVPCLNDDDEWIDVLKGFCQELIVS